MSELRGFEADRPEDGPAQTRGRIDADRIRELTAVGDAKGLDPGVRVYDPLEHVPRAKSQEPVESSDAERVAEAEPKVGGVGGDRPSRPEGADDRAAAVDAGEAPAEDDFGPVDAERWSQVPCADQRPQRVYELETSEAPLTETESDAVAAAKVRIAEVLRDAADELTADDVRESLQYINPTGGRRNCVECAKAVDDTLRGHAAVAGPTDWQSSYYVEAALSVRAVDYVEDSSAVEIERALMDAGPGARGIVVGWSGGSAIHAYNVANIGGELYWLDGQSDVMSEHDPHGYKSLDMYRTG